MKEERYSISEASRLLELENHVLRYWEEELELNIPRNEQGHRYYQQKEIKLLSCIKELKNKGFQLKAVKEILPDLEENQKIDVHKLLEAQVELENTDSDGELTVAPADEHSHRDFAREEQQDKVLPFPAHKENASLSTSIRNNEEKMQEFEAIMGRIVGKALREQAEEIGDVMGDQICRKVIREIDESINEQAEKTEEYFKKLDEAIRTHQKARQEAAVAREEGGKRKSRFFRKNKRKI